MISVSTKEINKYAHTVYTSKTIWRAGSWEEQSCLHISCTVSPLAFFDSGLWYLKGNCNPQIMRDSNKRQAHIELVQNMCSKTSSDLKGRNTKYAGTLQNEGKEEKHL